MGQFTGDTVLHICFKFSADILFDQGLNFVFLELETFIRHVYLHTWFVSMI